jgi:squalene/oxidosqualene cyclase-like protein
MLSPSQSSSPTASFEGALPKPHRPGRDKAPAAASDRRVVLDAIGLAQENLRRLQAEDGHWPGDYGGPMFLLPMLVALYSATGTLDRVPLARREGMVRYYFSVLHADGGIGLHAEDKRGMLFTTVLGYAALRILGVPVSDPRLATMRTWIKDHGGPTGAAPWGKWTLALLGLYEWEGVHPVLPELWLMPESVPFHPSRMWCHCRQVYLPVAWLYGTRATARETPLVRALREELYGGEWHRVDWAKARDTLSPADSYRPASVTLRAANTVMDGLETVMLRPLRRRALATVLEHITYEDDVTSGIDIGPVNKVLNAFVHFFHEPEGPRFARALARTEDYLWDAPDGTKMQGYNGSQLWDTAFAIQALLASPRKSEAEDVLAKAYGFLRDTQILEDVPERGRYYRHASRGGWPFSTRAHGWPITDCTSEGLKCALALAGKYLPGIPDGLLEDAVRLILSWQNDDGGWATYERQRAGAWMEALNPSEVFGDIMVDYSYVECTSACVQALAAALASPLRLTKADLEQAKRAIGRGVAFLRKVQVPDGSFEGSWGVCFSYGTWFGVTGLLAGGVSKDDPAITRACSFLLARQRPDGSWGEDGDSCRERRWVEADGGRVVQTSWALMTLLRAGTSPGRTDAVHRAAAFLVERQTKEGPDMGGWPKEPLVGVFNRTCLIDYDNYRQYFPLWALSEYVGRPAQVPSGA